MRKYLILFVLAFVSVQLVAQEKKASGPVLTFEKNTHDFGDIYQGDRVEKVFTFTNTGNEPLIISDIRVTCGCTVPKWPRQPIMPGEKGEITVGFNSAGKMGKQNKTVTVISNTVGDDALITFTTNVLAKDPQ